MRGINIDLNPSCIDMFNIIRKDDENICHDRRTKQRCECLC